MLITKIHFFFLIFLFYLSLSGCVTRSTTPNSLSLLIKNGLPESKLEYFNDSFEKLRENLWDKGGYISNQSIRSNFKLANVRIENDKFRIDTKIGSFSKGGLGSKYTIKGDFDLQIDCVINFMDGLYDMDQMLHFVVYGMNKESHKIDGVIIGLTRIGGRSYNTIFSGQVIDGMYNLGSWQKIGNFNGTLRIVRIGTEISTFFRQKKAKEVNKIHTFKSTPNDVMVGFRLQNYGGKRTSITAEKPVSATFDNFKINAAQGIKEGEI